MGAGLDLLIGALWLLWPGLWQELVHPWAMGSTFDALQARGVARLSRAALWGWVWHRRARAQRQVAGALASPAQGPAVEILRIGQLGLLLVGAWVTEILPELLSSWQMGGAGPVAWIVHLVMALCALVMSVAAWRWAGAPRAGAGLGP